MRKLALIALLLTGCTQTLTLFPRGGGQQATGNLDMGSWGMTVNLDGDTYAGSFARASSPTFGNISRIQGGQFSTSQVIMSAGGNQYSALLISKGKTLRCEFVTAPGSTGNGICTAGDGRVFDLLLN